MLNLKEMNRLEGIAKRHNINLRKIKTSSGNVTFVFDGFNEKKPIKTGIDLIEEEYNIKKAKSVNLLGISLQYLVGTINHILKFKFFEIKNRFNGTTVNEVEINNPVGALVTVGAFVAAQIDILNKK